MNVANPITHLSLCSGYGGLDLGIKRVFPGLRTICYVEREISACEILGAQMEKGNLDLAPIWSDVKTFPAGYFRGMVDIISGGYPCQPFSVAGKQQGTEDPRHLWPFIRDIVGSIRPGICIFENVRGHVRLGLSEVLGDLRSLGYRVRAGIFAASEVGAPHRRERVFILGVSSGNYERRSGQRSRQQSEQDRGSGPSMANPVSVSTGQGIHKGKRTEGKRAPGIGGSISCVADSDNTGSQGRGESGERSDKLTSGPLCERCEILEEPISERRRRGSNGSGPSAQRKPESKNKIAGSCFTWPLPPGPDQHEWEEPRTVNGKLNPSWVAQMMGLPSDWVSALVLALRNEVARAWKWSRATTGRACNQDVDGDDVRELKCRCSSCKWEWIEYRKIIYSYRYCPACGELTTDVKVQSIDYVS